MAMKMSMKKAAEAAPVMKTMKKGMKMSMKKMSMKKK